MKEGEIVVHFCKLSSVCLILCAFVIKSVTRCGRMLVCMPHKLMRKEVNKRAADNCLLKGNSGEMNSWGENGEGAATERETGERLSLIHI